MGRQELEAELKELREQEPSVIDLCRKAGAVMTHHSFDGQMKTRDSKPVYIEAALRVEVSAEGSEANYVGKHLGMALFGSELKTITHTFLVRFSSVEEMIRHWRRFTPEYQQEICQALRMGPMAIQLKSFRWVGYWLPEGMELTPHQANMISGMVAVPEDLWMPGQM